MSQESVEDQESIVERGNEEINTKIPAKGQSNLGNTCFFNSVMQCLMHTHHLDYYFNRFGRVDNLTFSTPTTVSLCEEKIELPAVKMKVPEEDSPLNDVLRVHICEFRNGHTPDPRRVFSEVTRMAPRFKGWAQQDAHELLRYLLDGLRNEEQERYKTAIANHFGVPKEKRSKRTPPLVVKRAKAYLQAAGRPLLDSVFGGTLLQTIRCQECDHVSESKEQFLDLSIPISPNVMASGRMNAGHHQQTSYKTKKESRAAKKMEKKAARRSKIISKENGSDTTATSESEDSSEASLAKRKRTVSSSESEKESEEEMTDDERMSGGEDDKLDLTEVLATTGLQDYDRNSIVACLLDFTKSERLRGSNSYECEACCAPENKKNKATGVAKKRVEADKRYLIYEPPVVLTLQLKRFQQIHSNGRISTSKLSGNIEFPQIFDLAPFCCKGVQRIAPKQKNIHYSLYGVVVHSGGLGGGHYIAYVKSRQRIPRALEFLEAARTTCVDSMVSAPNLTPKPTCELGYTDGQWYYCSDNNVRAVSEKEVLNSEAYILFYERIY